MELSDAFQSLSTENRKWLLLVEFLAIHLSIKDDIDMPLSNKFSMAGVYRLTLAINSLKISRQKTNLYKQSTIALLKEGEEEW